MQTRETVDVRKGKIIVLPQVRTRLAIDGTYNFEKNEETILEERYWNTI